MTNGRTGASPLPHYCRTVGKGRGDGRRGNKKIVFHFPRFSHLLMEFIPVLGFAGREGNSQC